MQAAILSIGDELVLGRTLDTNSRWLSSRLAALGAMTGEHRTVGDDQNKIAATAKFLAAAHDLLIMTGGLGPTADDLTRFALGDLFSPGKKLVEDADAVRNIRIWFDEESRVMPANNLVQALRPEAMRCLRNDRGTAPGLAGEWNECSVFALPGPPGEMKPMFDRFVAERLPGADSPSAVHTRAVLCFGIGESEAAERLGNILRRDVDPAHEPLVGITVSRGIIRATLMMQGRSREIRPLLEQTTEHIEQAWRPWCFARDEVSLSSVVGEDLRRSGLTLATAESCTGGLLGKMIVDTPGSTNYYRGGWITYANSLKESQLRIPPAVIRNHGAVSPETAAAMAGGAQTESGADIGLSITGIAGPGGGTPEKPEGTVFIGLATRKNPPQVRHFAFPPGNRFAIRERSAKSALQLLRFHLLSASPENNLIWDVGGSP